MFSFINVIHIIIIFQGTLLTLYIFLSNKEKTKTNFLLATIIGVLTIQVLSLFLAARKIETHFFQSINSMYSYAYGPLLFLYNRSVTRAQFKFQLKDFFHFIPSLIILLNILFNYNDLFLFSIYVGYPIHIVIYLFFCFLEVRTYKKVIMDNYSMLEWLNLGWLQWTFAIFSLIVLVDVIQFIFFLSNFSFLKLEALVFMLILAAINILYFKGFMPTRDLAGIHKEDIELSSSISLKKKRHSDLNENSDIIKKINSHIAEFESFKNPNLTIALLAEELGINKRTLSELINDYYHVNFSSFINSYRINHAKQRLTNQKNRNETILEILYDVGFNSKSSFNTSFKKNTGLTPSEFKNKYM